MNAIIAMRVVSWLRPYADCPRCQKA